jgi:hypothetical protein
MPPQKRRTRAEIEAEMQRLQEEADALPADQGNADDDGPEVWEYRRGRSGREYRVRHRGEAARRFLSTEEGDDGGQGDDGGDGGQGDDGGDGGQGDDGGSGSVWGRRRK